VARWNLVAVNPDESIPLAKATGRRITFRLKAAADLAFELDGRSEEAAAIVERATDVVAWRDGVKLYRGRVAPSSDKVGRARHSFTVQTADYRALLGRRKLYDELVFAAVDQAEVALELVDYTQALTGGDLGIVQGTGFPTGVLRDRTYPVGKWIGEALEELGEVIDGFEWEIDAELALNVYYPERGQVLDDPDHPRLVYGVNVVELERTPGPFSNAWQVTGSAGLATEVRESAGLAADQRGRWDEQASYPEVVEQATLAEKADRLLADQEDGAPSYKVELSPGWWQGPGHVWLGDWVPLTVRSGRLDETVVRRVWEIEVAPNENGTEKVVVTLNRPPAARGSRKVAELARRLEVLERTV
jgi:hypothetical protein